MQDIKFEIDQLRKDKIIYATESVAVTLGCLLVLYFSEPYLSGVVKTYVDFLCGALALGYLVYMGVTNFIRLSKIKELENKL